VLKIGYKHDLLSWRK